MHSWFFPPPTKRHFSGSPLRPQSRWKRWSYTPLCSSSVSWMTWAPKRRVFNGKIRYYPTEEIFEEKTCGMVCFFWHGHLVRLRLFGNHISKPFRPRKNSENYKNPLKKNMLLASKISGNKNETSSLQVDTFSTHRTEFHVGNGT